MKEFKKFVIDKCKESGVLDTENIYFSQTRDIYYADYKPNYPEKKMVTLQFLRKLYLVKEKCMEILML